MSIITLGILGGGQLGSMLSVAAKKLNIKTLIYSDDQDAPAQNFCAGASLSSLYIIVLIFNFLAAAESILPS